MSVPATPGRLSNEDFRKILSTPRAAEPATPSRFAKYDPNYVPEFKKPEAPSSGSILSFVFHLLLVLVLVPTFLIFRLRNFFFFEI